MGKARAMALSDLTYLNADDCAEYLRVRKDALQRLVKAGRIPAPNYELGPRQPRWNRIEIDSVMGNLPHGNTPQTLMEKYIETVENKQRRRPYPR